MYRLYVCHPRAHGGGEREREREREREKDVSRVACHLDGCFRLDSERSPETSSCGSYYNENFI